MDLVAFVNVYNLIGICIPICFKASGGYPPKRDNYKYTYIYILCDFDQIMHTF